MNLDFAKVCGKHIGVYEAYYKQVRASKTRPWEANGNASEALESTHQPTPTPY